MDAKDIKNVAIYLRKSRDKEEEKDVLIKHRMILTDYANKQGWNYTIYEEIVSGALLYNRKEMLHLLEDISAKKFDGVLVMEFERITRGDEQDYGEIINKLRSANCNIITPNRIYNPNDKQDKVFLRMQGAFSSLELDTTIERFQNGKKVGAENGRLTNGNPPYPYYKNRKVIKDDKGKIRVDFDILVDPEKRKVYDLIKEMYLTGLYGTEKIAIYLNKQGYKSPKEKNWSTNAVSRILLHEFHVGIVSYGKYEWKKNREGNRKPTRKRDKNELSSGKGDWEVLKTEEEHQKILQIMQKNNKIPSRAKQGVFPTSGLLYCKQCGYSMKYSIGRKEAKTGKRYNYTKCSYTNPIGEKCPQRGVKLTEEFYEALYNTVITSYLNNNIIEKAEINKQDIEKMQQEIDRQKKQLVKQENYMNRIKDAYLAEIYTLLEFGEEKKKVDTKIKSLKKDIERIESDIVKATSYSKEELDKKIKIFKRDWKKATTAKEQNDLLKTIVKRIFYNREGDTVTLEIEYL